MPRKEQGWITFQTSQEERKILEEFCQESQRTKTEILRELVRSLHQYSSPSLSLPKQSGNREAAPTQKLVSKTRKPKKTRKHGDTEHTYQNEPEIEISSQTSPLKVSSPNVLKGVVKRVIGGAVNSEVTLEIVQKVELISMITRVSAEELELQEGQEAYAVIKSNDIVIARE
ncbi:TOBE domain-containing protein [Calothrix brevissima NIES-22]|nr:TOBE domain-containing protein [Calothrix brevissima NIES-22]